MLAAISRDDSILSGGISPVTRTAAGKAVVEPLAWLTPSGRWKDIPCSSDNQTGCLQFEKQFVRHPHRYLVIGSDGKGAAIDTPPTKLDECYGYSVVGIYSGADVANWTIAANTTSIFGDSPPLNPISDDKAAEVQKALVLLGSKQVDSTSHLLIFSLRLEGKDLVVVQRAFADLAPSESSDKSIFAIGSVVQERFRILHWKQGDEDERILGTVHLKSGRDFLITVANDTESHRFRVYGIRKGHLALVYSGGGSSC
jgi:hypothetical protein